MGKPIVIPMRPFPEVLIEVGMVVAGSIGLLILIAPNFGMKPKQTASGWRFPVKPTCLLLYALALCCGIGAVAFSSSQLLARGSSCWQGWIGFAFGFLVVPLVLADWPEPLILDAEGVAESGSASSQILWQELEHIRAYRIRCDRGIVLQGYDGRQLVVADVAYDTDALLNRLLQFHAVPFYAQRDEADAVSILSDHHTQH
jgi:hypothetical protein